jgi:hypothetical protein
VKQFFCLLSSLYDKYNFYSDNIYNVDETGILTVPSKQIKVLGLTGKRQVGGLSSAGRGVLVTAEIFMSACSNLVPLMFVFPLARENKELLDDAPPGSTAGYHFSGWIQTDIFLKWFRRFIEIAMPTEGKPLVLVLDGDGSETESLELIELVHKSHVVLMCFPSHTTHRLQPLDDNFPVVILSHSNNQDHSATKYSSPYYPTCRVKQGICIILQNP